MSFFLNHAIFHSRRSHYRHIKNSIRIQQQKRLFIEKAFQPLYRKGTQIFNKKTITFAVICGFAYTAGYLVYNIQKTINQRRAKEEEQLEHLRQELIEIYRAEVEQAIQREDHKNALPSIEMALMLRPHDFTLHNLKGIICLHLHQWEESLECFANVIRLAPDDNGKAIGYINQGTVAVERGLWDEAVALYDKAMLLDPNNFGAHYNKGTAYMKAGQFTLALASLEEAIKIKPQEANAHFRKGIALLGSKNPEDALQSLDNAIHLDPYHREAYINKALILIILNKNWLAVDCMNESLKKMPDFVYGYNYKGIALCAMKRCEEALEVLEKALELDNTSFLAHLNKGIALQCLSRFSESEKSYTEASHLQPQRPESYLGRGMCLYSLQRWDEAVQALNTALLLDPSCLEYYCLRGLALQADGNSMAAISDYDKVLMMDDSQASVHLAKGKALVSLGRHDEAIDCYHKAITLTPDPPLQQQGYILMGDANFASGHHQTALSNYDEALHHPSGGETPLLYQKKAAVLLLMDRTEDAVDLLSRAALLEPEDHQLHYQYARVLFRVGRLGEASTALEQSLRVAPGISDYHVLQAALLAETEKFGEAAEAAEEAIRVDSRNSRAYVLKGSLVGRQGGEVGEAVRLIDEGILLDPQDYTGYYFKGKLLLSHPDRLPDALINLEKAADLSHSLGPLDERLELVPPSMVSRTLSRAYTKKGKISVPTRPKKAVAFFDRAVQVDPTNYAAYVHKGKALVLLDRVEEALATLDKAVEVTPDKAWAYQEKGDLLEAMGDLTSAVDCYRHVVELTTSPSVRTDLYTRLAAALVSLGDPGGALGCYDRLVAASPGDARLQLLRGEALSSLGRYDEAIESFNKVLELGLEDEEMVSKAGLGRVSAQVHKVDVETRINQEK